MARKQTQNLNIAISSEHSPTKNLMQSPVATAIASKEMQSGRPHQAALQMGFPTQK